LLVAVPFLPGVGGVVLAGHVHDLHDGQVVFLGEGEVALVVRRHAHDGAVAVGHEHVVADPDFDLRARDGVRDEQARGHAFFFTRGHFGLGGAAKLALFDERGQRRIVGRRVRGQRVFGRHGAERHAHDRVGAGGEDVQLAVLDQLAVLAGDLVREGKAQAFGLADPVFLHQAHALGPAGQVVLNGAQQFVGVIGDAQVVTGDLALFNEGAGTPAAAVDDLFVGQHGLVDRIPVDDLGLAVGDALFEHLQEQPLIPLVVLRIAGAHFARPIDCQTHRLHLLLHVGDVVVGPLGGRHLGLDGGVFAISAGMPKASQPMGMSTL